MENASYLFVSTKEEFAQQVMALLVGKENRIRWTAADNALNEIVRERPDLIILIHGEEVGLESIISIRKETLVPLVYIVEERNPLFIRDAFRLGATDVLLFPEEASQMEERLAKAMEQGKREPLKGEDWLIDKQQGGGKRSQVVTFYAGKGGCGRSLVAATLAQTIRLDLQIDTILLDFNMQFGQIEGYLGMEGGRTFTELKSVLSELNDLQIKSVVSRVPGSGLEVFVSPKDIFTVEDWSEQDVRLLFRALRTYYQVIVVDTPVEIDDLSFAVLRQSDLVYYVLTPDMPSLHTFRRALIYLDHLGINPKEKLRIVLNKVSSSADLKTSDLIRLLPYPIEAVIREDAIRVRDRLRKKMPLRIPGERPKNAVAGDVQRWVRRMEGIRKVVERDPTALFGRLRSLFRREKTYDEKDQSLFLFDEKNSPS